MARTKKNEVVIETAEEVVEETAEEVVEETAEEVVREEISVVWSGGIRTYTKNLHGKDFEKLANEFSSKKNGHLV